MNKQVFLEELRKSLAGFPQDEVDGRLAFYGEMIDDRIEEGLAEEEAVAELGPVDRIAEQTVSEIPIQKLVKEKIKTERRLRPWQIVLLVVGAPLWVALLIAALAVLLAVYMVIWAVIVALWAADAAFALSAVGGLAAAVMLFVRKDPVQGLLMISAALVLAGLAIFAFYGCLAATKGAAILTKKIALGIKSKLRRKGAAQ